MQTFVKVAQAGSFTAVANQMGVPRSLITRQIASLERSLGMKLMTRSTRSLSLTTAGAAYLEKCRVILNLVDAAETSLSTDHTTPKGLIRIGLPLSFGLERVLPLLLDFAKLHSEIELAMDFSDRHSNLIEEGLDLSIRITSNPQSTDILRKLGESRLITAASSSYLKKYGAPRTPEELNNHLCLDYSLQHKNSSWLFKHQGQESRVPIHARLVANNGDALVQAAIKGMGVVYQPDFILDKFIATGELTHILKGFETSVLGIYALLPSNRYIPHRISVLLEYLSQSIAPD
jgi:DNA-binding transcriptional LysR family regulator